jgi:hypothetical protein
MEKGNAALQRHHDAVTCHTSPAGRPPNGGFARLAQNHRLRRFADKIHDAYLGSDET